MIEWERGLIATQKCRQSDLITPHIRRLYIRPEEGGPPLFIRRYRIYLVRADYVTLITTLGLAGQIRKQTWKGSIYLLSRAESRRQSWRKNVVANADGKASGTRERADGMPRRNYASVRFGSCFLIGCIVNGEIQCAWTGRHTEGRNIEQAIIKSGWFIFPFLIFSLYRPRPTFRTLNAYYGAVLLKTERTLRLN